MIDLPLSVMRSFEGPIKGATRERRRASGLSEADREQDRKQRVRVEEESGGPDLQLFILLLLLLILFLFLFLPLPLPLSLPPLPPWSMREAFNEVCKTSSLSLLHTFTFPCCSCRSRVTPKMSPDLIRIIAYAEL
ncbi:hypothetical protein E2C01_091876 [Portunus trituberculatus]|uniref:Uncharacterized protein n=1 Tax=Portunus trituberculatus TaxID=210409 RepID=A0A5B7JQJ8_PORTR|nr:hypothetical protein [Portunus trituberculatus]